MSATDPVSIHGISAITFATRNMAEATGFYLKLGMELVYGGPTSQFSSLRAGTTAVNLTTESHGEIGWWGRAIFHVADVDGFYMMALKAGLTPDAPPQDAVWGERYFHIRDPDGHELSFATPLPDED